MLSVKQGCIKYHFLSLWYDLTWDGTQFSRAIGQHSNHYTQVRYFRLYELIKKLTNAEFGLYIAPTNSKTSVWILLDNFFQEFRSPKLEMRVIHECVLYTNKYGRFTQQSTLGMVKLKI